VSLSATLEEARTLAAGRPEPDLAADVFERIVRGAAASPAVTDALRDVPAGRALVRFTDAEIAFEFQAGEGRLSIDRAELRGKGPKVDAASEVWLGLMAGTLKPWLAFTRGLVVCRAGLNELRWLQQVAERLQGAYARMADPNASDGVRDGSGHGGS
jgi:hypothetical protein